LFLQGVNKVRHYIITNDSRRLNRYCDQCNRFYGFRTVRCRECGSEMRITSRMLVYKDYEHGDYDPDMIIKISMEQFVETLDGKYRYIAKRWLLDRVDLMYDNHLKQLALELGMSAPRIAKLKKSVRERYIEWQR